MRIKSLEENLVALTDSLTAVEKRLRDPELDNCPWKRDMEFTGLPLMERARLGEPITAGMYIAAMRDGGLQSQEWRRYKYVVDQEEAIQAITALRCDIQMPILVLLPIEFQDYLKPEDIKAQLEVADYVNVHRMTGLQLSRDAKTTTPTELTTQYATAMPSAEAIEFMFNDHVEVGNALDMGCNKVNPYPRLLRHKNWRLMHDTKNSRLAGKEGSTIPNDVSACTAFTILGKIGAFSVPHIDHHGVVTTILCEFGVKLWLTFPEMVEDELAVWGKNRASSGGLADPYPLFLQQGTLLIQPRGRVHAPYTIETCAMTGTMHWHSAAVHDIVEQSILERKYPEITNEDSADQFAHKLYSIIGMYRKRHGGYDWPDHERLNAFEEKVDQYLDGDKAYLDHLVKVKDDKEICNCAPGPNGCSSTCSCRRRDAKCLPGCHKCYGTCSNCDEVNEATNEKRWRRARHAKQYLKNIDELKKEELDDALFEVAPPPVPPQQSGQKRKLLRAKDMNETDLGRKRVRQWRELSVA